MSFTMTHAITLPYPLPAVLSALANEDKLERLQRLAPEAQVFTLLPGDEVRVEKEALARLQREAHPKTAQGLPRPMDLTPVHGKDTLGGDGETMGDGGTAGGDAETVAGGKATAPVPRSVTADTFITLPRTHFEFSGTVSALCGLVHSQLGVTGCQIVYSGASGVVERGCSANAPVVDANTLLDDTGAGAAGLPNAHGTPIVLFESAVQGRGIRELKLRTFRVVSVEAVESPHDRPGGSSRTKPRKSLTEVRETVWGTCPNYLAPLLRVLAPRVHRAHMEEYWKLFEDEEGA